MAAAGSGDGTMFEPSIKNLFNAYVEYNNYFKRVALEHPQILLSYQIHLGKDWRN